MRELENPVQLALIDFGTLSDVDGIGSLLSSPSEDAQSSPKLPAFGDDLTVEEAERLHIEAALQRCECNKTRAASILGVERKSLYRKLKRFGVEVDDESIEG